MGATAIAGLVITAVGTAATVYSQYEQQKSQNAANDFNSQMLQRGAQAKEIQAQTALEQGKVAEDAQRKKVQSVIGSQRAQAAASGLLVDSGTTQQVTEDTAGFGELDALAIRNNAQREAWGIRNESQDLMLQSSLVQSKNASPFMAAMPSLLAGGSKLATGIYGYQQQFGSPTPPKH
jgi:hypothetical protein